VTVRLWRQDGAISCHNINAINSALHADVLTTTRERNEDTSANVHSKT